MKSRYVVLAAAALSSLCSIAQAAPVDLTDWVRQGSGNWQLQAGNNAVLQRVNTTGPTFFVNNANSQGQQLSGTIQVQTRSDDDFIGFVLGYNVGDLSNASADYLLIDWKQGDQPSGGCTGRAGLAISRVTGTLTNGRGPWCHDPDFNVTELARATNLGFTGWADNTEYTFDLVFQPTRVKVLVDGVEEISVSGSFTNGSFGFYNYSQENVLYAGLQQVEAPAIPVPAALPLMASGLGLIGALRLRRRKAQG